MTPSFIVRTREEADPEVWDQLCAEIRAMLRKLRQEKYTGRAMIEIPFNSGGFKQGVKMSKLAWAHECKLE